MDREMYEKILGEAARINKEDREDVAQEAAIRLALLERKGLEIRGGLIARCVKFADADLKREFGKINRDGKIRYKSMIEIDGFERFIRTKNAKYSLNRELMWSTEKLTVPPSQHHALESKDFAQEMLRRLQDAVSERDYLVTTMSVDGLLNSEIAEEIGVTEARVSQIRKRVRETMEVLRGNLSA